MNLISTAIPDENNIRTMFSKGTYSIINADGYSFLCRAKKRSGELYELYVKLLNMQQNTSSNITKSNLFNYTDGLKVWRNRLGHTNHQAIKDMHKVGAGKGLNLDAKQD